MSSQQRFEGPVLEDLLERVRREAGRDVKIVAANRVRRGGVGGFFTKEHFEVVVEERDEQTAVAMAIAVDDPPPMEAFATFDAIGATTSSTPSTSGRRAPRSVLDLVEATNDDERTQEVIDLGHDQRRDQADRPMPVVSTQMRPFHEILEQLTDAIDPEVDAPSIADDPVVERTVAPSINAEPTLYRPSSIPTATANVASTPTTVPAPAPVVRAAVTTAPSETIERPENALARLGVPKRHIPRGVAPGALRAALIESLAALPVPRPVPDANGVVIAVVGAGDRAVELARTLADEQGLDPDNVVIATPTDLGDDVPAWLQVNDAPTADERRRSWRRRPNATFVALPLPDVNGWAGWARGMLDALEPTQVWGLASAAAKPEDVAAWGEALGGLDVLALDGLDATVSPASALTLGVPVGRLDGAPASPLRWADVLLARMMDAASR